MTTWTLRQIDQAQGLSHRVAVSHPAVLESAGLAAELAGAGAAEALVEAAHTFGIELHPGDLTVEPRELPELAATQITVRWRPTTREVVPVGGPLDGEVGAHRLVPEPLVVALGPTLAWGGPDVGPHRHPRSMNYYLAGWHETDRRWVYTPTGRL